MREIKPPYRREWSQMSRLPTIFLAGSIEMGVAEHWQKRIVNDLADVLWVAYNPRRDARNPNWEQSLSNPHFTGQVNWEEDHLITSDLALFYFDPTTKSPITIGELNLIRGLGRSAVVLCPDGFWRKGNIDIWCQRSSDHVTQVDRYDGLIEFTKTYCNNLIAQRYTGSNIDSLSSKQIFVFGSNQEGKHYGGSAKVAHEQFGAERWVGEWMTGQCYAIPTMTRPQTEAHKVIQCAPEELEQSMKQFFEYTRSQTHLQFLMTRVGCGVAGWWDEYMRELFWRYFDPRIDDNIVYPIEFEQGT